MPLHQAVVKMGSQIYVRLVATLRCLLLKLGVVNVALRRVLALGRVDVDGIFPLAAATERCPTEEVHLPIASQHRASIAAADPDAHRTL
eukprot:268456-Amphidinium_carterae.2